MKSKPNISVVINVRNEAEHLDKCLKSIKDFAFAQHCHRG
jgi:glycosyltransferase involved in cell wall biosynthesis